MSFEGIVVISCGSVSGLDIIREIIQVELPNPVNNHNLDGYRWSIDTKYYSAETVLYELKEKMELAQGLTESIRAVVFYFDSKKETSFKKVKSWLPYLKDMVIDVQLLVCDSIHADSQKPVLDWAVKNHYELIELNPSDGGEEDDDIGDIVGYKRVINALQAHAWSNLIMKTDDYKALDKDADEEDAEDVLENEACGGGVSVVQEQNNSTANSTKLSKEVISEREEDLSLEEQLVGNVLNGDDPGGESFEALFSKFASMKDKAEGLTGEERRKYAEKVAMSFWRAMGGDEDEILGLEDSDNEED